MNITINQISIISNTSTKPTSEEQEAAVFLKTILTDFFCHTKNIAESMAKFMYVDASSKYAGIYTINFSNISQEKPAEEGMCFLPPKKIFNETLKREQLFAEIASIGVQHLYVCNTDVLTTPIHDQDNNTTKDFFNFLINKAILILNDGSSYQIELHIAHDISNTPFVGTKHSSSLESDGRDSTKRHSNRTSFFNLIDGAKQIAKNLHCSVPDKI